MNYIISGARENLQIRNNTMNNIYLDNAATTKLSDSMKDYLMSILDCYGNPSSPYSISDKSRQIISNARKTVAKFINANTEDIYFTPSGSASNTLAIRGYYLKHNCCILYSPIAHKSILKCVNSCKYAFPLKVDNNGFIDFQDLKEWIDTRNIKPFVIIDFSNSEIGTTQDIKKIIELIHFYNGIIYLDCTGSIPYIPLDVKELNADMIGFSAHKIGGLKGCGVLYKKKNIELEPLIYGSQEHGLIGGTENILGIASLGKAVKDYDYSSISSDDRDYVYNFIVQNVENSYIVGASIESGNRLPHNLFVCFKGVEGESLMILLDMNGIQISTGSACNNYSKDLSSALLAIGMNKNDINSCVRLTFGNELKKDELLYVCNTIKKCVNQLRALV